MIRYLCKVERRLEVIEEELTKIVGGANVFNSLELLEKYSNNLHDIPRMSPRCIVKPGSADEIQDIVKWANKNLTPLVPISSGFPHFKDDTVPSTEGSVIVDLSRMNKIIHIDAINKVAMVEPGVTFGELQSELGKVGLCAYTPLVPRSTKSVIGSVLEREPITIPAHHWDSVDPLLCMEIILGTGDKIRTGEASGPISVEEQWELGKAQINPFGPAQMDMNRLVSGAQGTMGIITWATVKCNYKAYLTKSFFLTSNIIDPLIDLSYRLLRRRSGENLFIINGLNLACLLGHNSQEIQELKNELPQWILFISFEGFGEMPEEKVQYQEADLYDMAQEHGLVPQVMVSRVTSKDLSQLIHKPSSDPFWKLKYKNGFKDLFFLTTLDKTLEFVSEILNLANNNRFSSSETGVYIQPIVQGTSCHCEFSFYYDSANSTDKGAVKKIIDIGAEVLASKGAFFSRPYGKWADIAYRNAPDTLIIQRKLKKIFDPNGILNPKKLCF